MISAPWRRCWRLIGILIMHSQNSYSVNVGCFLVLSYVAGLNVPSARNRVLAQGVILCVSSALPWDLQWDLLLNPAWESVFHHCNKLLLKPRGLWWLTVLAHYQKDWVLLGLGLCSFWFATEVCRWQNKLLIPWLGSKGRKEKKKSRDRRDSSVGKLLALPT